MRYIGNIFALQSEITFSIINLDNNTCVNVVILAPNTSSKLYQILPCTSTCTERQSTRFQFLCTQPSVNFTLKE